MVRSEARPLRIRPEGAAVVARGRQEKAFEIPRPNPFIAGLSCRCPVCGEGPLFDGYLKVSRHCEACGQDFSRAESGDGPVVFILLIVGAIGCGGLLFSELVLHWPIWLEIVVWMTLIAVMTLWAMRPFKAIMIALQFHNQASEARRPD